LGHLAKKLFRLSDRNQNKPALNNYRPPSGLPEAQYRYRCGSSELVVSLPGNVLFCSSLFSISFLVLTGLVSFPTTAVSIGIPLADPSCALSFLVHPMCSSAATIKTVNDFVFINVSGYVKFV